MVTGKAPKGEGLGAWQCSISWPGCGRMGVYPVISLSCLFKFCGYFFFYRYPIIQKKVLKNQKAPIFAAIWLNGQRPPCSHSWGHCLPSHGEGKCSEVPPSDLPLWAQPLWYLRLASGQLPLLPGSFVLLRWKCFPSTLPIPQPEAWGVWVLFPQRHPSLWAASNESCGRQRNERVFKMSAADPEIHSWVNRASGDVFISGFTVIVT